MKAPVFGWKKAGKWGQRADFQGRHAFYTRDKGSAQKQVFTF
jgi:hypothetical protein